MEKTKEELIYLVKRIIKIHRSINFIDSGLQREVRNLQIPDGYLSRLETLKNYEIEAREANDILTEQLEQEDEYFIQEIYESFRRDQQDQIKIEMGSKARRGTNRFKY